MKIKYLHNGLERDVKNEIGTEMIAAGLAEQVLPEWKPLPVPQMYWAVRDGARVGDFLYAPSIQVKCPGCGKHTWHSSDKGTAHLTLEFRHLGGCNAMGVPEHVPAHIAEEYIRRWTAYAALSKKGKPPAPPALTSNAIDKQRDRAVMTLAGQKTREELIAEAKRLPVPVVGRKG